MTAGQHNTRIHPTHTEEAIFFYLMRKESIIKSVLDICIDYEQKTGIPPNKVYVNYKLRDLFEEEYYRDSRKVPLPVPSENITWFACTEYHTQAMPDACFVVVMNTEKPGVVCTL